MSRTLRVAVSQLNPIVGDIIGNENLLAEAMNIAEAAGADLCVAGELSLSGYPPEDLVRDGGFLTAQADAVTRLGARSGRCATLVGWCEPVSAHTPTGDSESRPSHNTTSWAVGGRTVMARRKQLLPNYNVFDERRWFEAGSGPLTCHQIAGVTVGTLICEDIWDASEVADAAATGIDVLVVANASPFEVGKDSERIKIVTEAASTHQIIVIYVNLVGGQDEIVFDGGSIIADADGVIWRAPSFQTGTWVLDIEIPDTVRTQDVTPEELVDVAVSRIAIAPVVSAPADDDLTQVWDALVVGLRDYVDKNRFPHVWLGLSGGIDSAIVAAIAADAIGGHRVHGITMPGPFSEGRSAQLAVEAAERIGAGSMMTVPIGASFDVMIDALSNGGPFATGVVGVAEENLQARLRGMILMAASNRHGGIVVTTGNRSETAVGYCTLYGDMCGGYAVIKDVPKTMVFALSRWRNSPAGLARWGGTPPIPEGTIDRPPSAELAADQTDEASLGSYEVLDAVLEAYVERALTPEQIVDASIADRGYVDRIVGLVDRNEYKRRQAAPGPKITSRAFGRERREPITNRWTHT